MRRRSVDLPHPDGPTMATNEPAAISRSMPSSATVPSPKTCRRPRAVTEVVGTSAARELKRPPELLLDLPLDAGPELIARLLRLPDARRHVDVEVPSLGAGRHPDLTSGPVAVDHEARAILELDRENTALEIGFEPVDLVQGPVERSQHAIGCIVECGVVDWIGHVGWRDVTSPRPNNGSGIAGRSPRNHTGSSAWGAASAKELPDPRPLRPPAAWQRPPLH